MAPAQQLLAEVRADEARLLHSALSDGERYDTWRRARADLIDIDVESAPAPEEPVEDVPADEPAEPLEPEQDMP
ncbi:MAG: hypothetical protein R6V19_08620 [Armatimonadota bacterium]